MEPNKCLIYDTLQPHEEQSTHKTRQQSSVEFDVSVFLPASPHDIQRDAAFLLFKLILFSFRPHAACSVFPFSVFNRAVLWIWRDFVNPLQVWTTLATARSFTWTASGGEEEAAVDGGERWRSDAFWNHFLCVRQGRFNERFPVATGVLQTMIWCAVPPWREVTGIVKRE